jgi:Domain of unknown function (DUF4129)
MSPRRRALIGVAAMLLLLIAVAIASTGSVPAGAGGARRPADRIVDVLITLYLLLMLVGLGMWVYIFLVRKDAVADALASRARRRPWVSTAILVIGFSLLAVFIRWLSTDEGLRQRIAARLHRGHAASPTSGELGASRRYEPEFSWGPVVLVVAIVLVAVVALYLSHRARRRMLDPLSASLLPALADVLDETLDDLRAEQDPRRAVIAAYARMERALGAYGLPRHPSEAPDEYLQRIFTDLDVSRLATSRLTALFSWAKFSGHDVAPEMKQEAIQALEAVREELRAAEILAEHERLASLTERRERAASA